MTRLWGRASPIEDDRVRRAAEFFASSQERERLRLWRMHLQSTVGSMNRLAYDLAIAAGRKPSSIAHELRPPLDWPWCTFGAKPARTWKAAALALRHTPLTSVRAYSRAAGVRWLQKGSARPASRRDRLVFVAVGGCLEVEGEMSSVRIETDGVRASLEIPDDLPETVVVALAGRTVDALFSHPLLDGRDYRIESVEHVEWASLRITFVTGSVHLVLPWRRLLRDA